MQIATITNQPFAGKMKETKNGNSYEKSNSGKLIGPVIALGVSAITLKTMKKSNFVEDLFADELTFLKENFPKINPQKLLTGYMIGLFALLGLIYGAITDAISNKTSRNDADQIAENGKIKENTNKGKMVGLGLSMVYGLVTLASVPLMAERIGKKSADLNVIKEEVVDNLGNKFDAEKYSKVVKSLIPLGMAEVFAFGAIYDYGVNKFRDKLRDKIEINDKIDEIISEKLQNA